MCFLSHLDHDVANALATIFWELNGSQTHKSPCLVICSVFCKPCLKMLDIQSSRKKGKDKEEWDKKGMSLSKWIKTWLSGSSSHLANHCNLPAKENHCDWLQRVWSSRLLPSEPHTLLTCKKFPVTRYLAGHSRRKNTLDIPMLSCESN